MQSLLPSFPQFQCSRYKMHCPDGGRAGAGMRLPAVAGLRRLNLFMAVITINSCLFDTEYRHRLPSVIAIKLINATIH